MNTQVSDKLPEGFVPRQQWPEYDLLSTALPSLKPSLIGENPVGIRWGKWPFYFEEYWSDTEPDLSLSNLGNPPNRVILWRRVARADRPKGWCAFSKVPSQVEGFAEISNAEYWKEWSESARRYRNRWLSDYLDKAYAIRKTNHDEFAQAYLKSSAAINAGRKMLDIAKRRSQNKTGIAEYTEFWVAHKLNDASPLAGMVIINSLSQRGSSYLCGFHDAEFGDAPLMVGLIDNWFQISRERGIKFLHFGRFWQEGDPENWKGFSSFKSKFGISYLSYPPVLFRFA